MIISVEREGRKVDMVMPDDSSDSAALASFLTALLGVSPDDNDDRTPGELLCSAAAGMGMDSEYIVTDQWVKIK